jgi:hypothetical protein
MYFHKDSSGNHILLPRASTTINDVPIEFEANQVRIAGIICSTDDDKLLCYFEDVATGKEVTIQLTEKDKNSNEQQVEKV